MHAYALHTAWFCSIFFRRSSLPAHKVILLLQRRTLCNNQVISCRPICRFAGHFEFTRWACSAYNAIEENVIMGRTIITEAINSNLWRINKLYATVKTCWMPSERLADDRLAMTKRRHAVLCLASFSLIALDVKDTRILRKQREWRSNYMAWGLRCD